MKSANGIIKKEDKVCRMIIDGDGGSYANIVNDTPVKKFDIHNFFFGWEGILFPGKYILDFDKRLKSQILIKNIYPNLNLRSIITHAITFIVTRTEK